MDKKLYKRALTGSAILGTGHYLAKGTQEWSNQDKIKKSVTELDEHLINRLTNVLEDASIERKRKFLFSFVVSKERLDFQKIHNEFGSAKKLISLPAHFSVKEDKELEQFVNKLKDEFKEIDFGKHKDLFKMTSKEIEFAALLEIYKSNHDLRLIDSFFVGFSAISAVNFSILIKSRKTLLSVSSLLFVIFMFGYFSNRINFLEHFALSKLLKHDDIELIESGLKYLNKQIQLAKLIGQDVEHLVSLFKEVKARYLELKQLSHPSDFKYDDKLQNRLREIKDKNLKEIRDHLKGFKLS